MEIIIELFAFILISLFYIGIAFITILGFCGFLYKLFEFVFWVFDALGVPNPFIIVYDKIESCIKSKS